MPADGFIIHLAQCKMVMQASSPKSIRISGQQQQNTDQKAWGSV